MKKKATAHRASVMSSTHDKSVFECVEDKNNSLRNSMLQDTLMIGGAKVENLETHTSVILKNPCG